MPEGVALSYLVERGMNWQEKVRQVLVKHKDLATAEDKQGKWSLDHLGYNQNLFNKLHDQ